jgi:hypothetical protein
MKAGEGMDVQIHVLLGLTLVGNKSSASHPGRFIGRERAHGTH